MILNAKTSAEVGYLSINVLRFWHSTIDCASFGLFSEVPLEVRMLTPFWLLALLHWWWRGKLLPGCLRLACRSIRTYGYGVNLRNNKKLFLRERSVSFLLKSHSEGNAELTAKNKR